MYRHVALLLLLLLVSPATHAINFYDIDLAKKYTGKMLLVLHNDQESNLSVLPSDIKKHIVGFMLSSIQEQERLSDTAMRVIFLK